LALLLKAKGNSLNRIAATLSFLFLSSAVAQNKSAEAPKTTATEEKPVSALQYESDPLLAYGASSRESELRLFEEALSSGYLPLDEKNSGRILFTSMTQIYVAQNQKLSDASKTIYLVLGARPTNMSYLDQFEELDGRLLYHGKLGNGTYYALNFEGHTKVEARRVIDRLTLYEQKIKISAECSELGFSECFDKVFVPGKKSVSESKTEAVVGDCRGCKSDQFEISGDEIFGADFTPGHRGAALISPSYACLKGADHWRGYGRRRTCKKTSY